MEKESELDMDDIPKKIQTTEWPPAVLERLDGYAEANSITLEDAQQKFVDYLSDKFAVESWQDEDEDFLLEASEGFVITSRGGGSGFQTENWVGMFVGVDPKARDKRKWMREQALSAYNEDKGKAIAAGLVGVCSKESDGTWHISGTTTNESSDNEEPWFLIPGTNLALLQTADWAKNKGDPIRAELWSRYYYFLGNTEGNFGNDVKLWRLDSPDTKALPNLFEPCRIKVIPNTSENQNPDFADVLRLPNKWASEISYTNDFVEDDLRAQLAPEKFCVNPALHEYFVALTDTLEHYQANLKEVQGLNPIGPIVLIKGKVTNLFKEGWDTEYDETGKTYNIRVTSWDLQRAHPSGFRGELNVRVSGFLNDTFHPFDYRDGKKWLPYAERSTILVCGRLGVQVNEEEGELPQIRAFGVHAVPRFVVPAAEGGNTSIDQFGE